MIKRFVNYFLKGLLVFVPAALTVLAVVMVIGTVDNWLRVSIPGVGLLLTVVFITFVGFLASNFIGKKIFDLIDDILARLPVVKMLHSALKDLIGAFAGTRKSFTSPVAVELVPGGPKALGFITRNDLAFLSMPGSVAVYLPQSYNFAGSVLIFPADRVEALNVNSSEVMAFIVSGGVSGK